MERLQYSTARTNNDDNWPIIGPSSLDEALLELDEAERQIEAGEGLPWESVLEEIKERYVYAH